MPVEYSRARREWRPTLPGLPADLGLADPSAGSNRRPTTLPSTLQGIPKSRAWIAVEPMATTNRQDGRKSRHLPESAAQAVTNRARPISSFADVHPKDFTIVAI